MLFLYFLFPAYLSFYCLDYLPIIILIIMNNSVFISDLTFFFILHSIWHVTIGIITVLLKITWEIA